jgi:hypothetical protein
MARRTLQFYAFFPLSPLELCVSTRFKITKAYVYVLALHKYGINEYRKLIQNWAKYPMIEQRLSFLLSY